MQHFTNKKDNFVQNRRNQRVKLVALLFTVLAVVMVAVGSISFLGAREIEDNYSQHLSTTIDKLDLINRLHHNSDDVRALLSELVSPHNLDKAEIVSQLKVAHDENTELIRSLEKLLVNPKNIALFKELVASRKHYYVLSDRISSMALNGQYSSAATYSDVYLNPIDHQHQEYLNDLSTNLQENIDAKSSKTARLLQGFVDYQEFLLAIVLLASICAVVLMQYLFSKMKQENSDLIIEVKKRQQLQNELYKSQQIYKSLFDNNPIPMWIFDLNTLQILNVNRAALRDYGYTKKEFLQAKISDLTADPEQGTAIEEIKSNKSQQTFIYNTKHKRNDGSLFQVEVHSHAMPEEDNIRPRLVVAVNVEDLMNAMERVENNEKLLREVSSSIPGAVYQFYMTKERNFGFTFISHGIKHLSGLSQEQLCQNANLVYQNVHPDDVEAMSKTTLASFKTLQPWELEFRIWHAELEHYVWVHGHSLPTRQADGSVHWNGTFIDISKQKEAQEELINNEANLRALLDSSPQAILLLNDAMEVLSFNRVASELVMNMRSLTLKAGAHVYDFIDLSLLADLREDHATAMSGRIVKYEAGSQNGWYEVMYRPVTSRDNRILAVSLNILDISEQKKSIEIIKHSKAQIARAQQLANLGNWEHDLVSNKLHWSDEVYKIYGEDKDCFTPSAARMYQKIHPEDREKVSYINKQALQARTPFAVEHRIILEDGSLRYIHEICEADFNTNGEPIRLSGTVQDVTKYKLAEREIWEAKNRLQSTLENIPEVIFSINSDLRMKYISPQSREVLGYQEEEFLMQNRLWFSIIHPADRKILTKSILPELLSGNRTSNEIRIIDSHKNVKWLMLRMSPMLGLAGKIIRIDGSAYDMTAYKNAEAKREELHEQLVQQNKNLQQFAYIVSHNLRAPIANIMGLTSIYDRKRPEAMMNQRVVDNLAVSARLLDNTIRDLNEILTVRSMITEAKEKVGFEQTMEHVLASISDDVVSIKAEIVFDFSAAPEIIAIRSYVHSIILNLVTNALKYRSDSRKLQLSLKSYKVSDYICLEVRDNGQGINLENNGDKIFGLYKRFHQNKEGKGIGLHLVKTQAELLGGKVEVESQVDQGSSFKVYLKHQE